MNVSPCGKQEVKLLEVDQSTKEERDASELFGGKDSDIMYTTEKLDSVDPVAGDDVICSVGRGRVTKIISVKILKKQNQHCGDDNTGGDKRCNDDDDNDAEQKQVRELLKYEVELTSWRLAGRRKVKCYMYKQALQVVRKKMLSEMNAQERVDFAQRQKASAAKVFKDKQYQHALNLYAGAVDSVRFVQHDDSSSNETRADLVEVMVTCSNNASTCCAQLGRWPEAAKFAQNALILLDALIDKKGGCIHTILISDVQDGGCGLCDAKLFGEWRVKSYILIARSLSEKKDYSGAIEILRRARNIIVEYSVVGGSGDGGDGGIKPTGNADRTKASVAHLRVQDKELRRLITSYMEHKKAEKKKEKQRAQAMFGSPLSSGKVTTATSGNDDDDDDDDAATGEEKKENTTPPGSPSLRGGSGRISRGEEENGDDEFATPPSTPAKEVRPKYVRMGDDVHKVSSSGRILPRQSSLKKNRTTASIDRRVSFSKEVEEREIDETYDDEEEESFVEQNKEALILVGVAGLAALSVFVLRGAARR